MIPHDALLPYQRTPQNHGWKVRPRYLPQSFGQKGLYVWLVDLNEQRITSKHTFEKIYYVETH